MKLSEFDVNLNVKVLAYGKSGTGKTCFAAGFPGPILLLDFDGKANSAADFFKYQLARLAQIEVVSLVPKEGFEPITRFLEVLAGLQKEQKKDEYTYRTLVLDSLTTFSGLMLKHIVSTNPATKRIACKQGVQPGMQDYGILKREFAKVIPGLLSLDMNIVMLGHIKQEKDETTGEIVRGVNMDGSFSADLPIYFEEVYRTYVKDGKYLAQTQADFRFDCRSQRGLKKEIELKYESLVKS